MHRDLSSHSLAFIEELYAQFLGDPDSVPEDWREHFTALGRDGEFASRPQLGPSFHAPSIFNPSNGGANGASVTTPNRSSASSGQWESAVAPVSPSNGAHAPLGSIRPLAPGVSDQVIRQDRVDQLIRAYRVRGHMMAKVDPLELPRANQPELDPTFYGLQADDLDQAFSSRTIYGYETLTLRQIISRLRNSYCRSIGVEFMHIHDLDVKNWLQDRMEGMENRTELSREEQVRIFTKLSDAVVFEEFIQKKYRGAKSFSLEGSQSIIPLLDMAIERAAAHGVDEMTLGMAHRGRLNVLANIMGKSARDIFREFEDSDPELYKGRGDVKYHMGFSSDYRTSTGKKVHLSLCFNPSHLEVVNPVVLGRVRAKQDRAGDIDRKKKAAILIHGDAAFAGEGIVQESLNMSGLPAYEIGGAIHIIINNQIGFTTPPGESRSTTYCTDVAKMLQVPIFHVNGEDPEAVAQVIRLAMDFRNEFSGEVIIDMYGYRRHGHNEGDEPAFTQPLLYRAIAERVSVQEGYLKNLLELGQLTREEAERIAAERREHLERELGEARRKDYVVNEDWLTGVWTGYSGGPDNGEDIETGVGHAKLSELLRGMTSTPDDFTPHKKIERILAQRAEMSRGKRPLDWGTAELLSFATLVTSGVRVRFTGQDAGRGTFSQRHAVLFDYEDGQSYMPLAHLEPNQAPIEISNSPLTETGVLGFEWGYSLDWPDGLVLWEAQFGDFVNVAQAIIDQFISSAEDKWRRLSGIVMLLPHGFEGMGPEHSSARLERFLTLAAEDNMQIVQPTTPAQYFHCLRRQVYRRWRKPLIVFTPKSLLRHPMATSDFEECTHGKFRRILPDELEPGRAVKRVLMCSGRVYYDLVKRREELGRRDIAIIRVEQLYPLPSGFLHEALDEYPDGTEVAWVQDEPENMGAWRHMRARFGEKIFGRLPFRGIHRAESASPATGSANAHKIEQEELLSKAFG